VQGLQGLQTEPPLPLLAHYVCPSLRITTRVCKPAHPHPQGPAGQRGDRRGEPQGGEHAHGTPEAHAHAQSGGGTMRTPEDVEGPLGARLIPVFLLDLPWEEPLLLDAKHQVRNPGKHQVRQQGTK